MVVASTFGLNSQYIKKLSLPELEERLKPFLAKYDLTELTKEQFDNLLTKFSPVKDSMPIIQTGSKKTLKIIFASKKDERLIFLTYGFVSKFLSNNEIKLIPYNIKEFENIPSYLNDLYMLSDKTYYCVINMNVSKFVIEHMNNSWDPKQTPKTQKFFEPQFINDNSNINMNYNTTKTNIPQYL